MVRQTSAAIYQLKITLKYSKPPIWRRVQVKSNFTLGTLHRILQIVMGWYDCHLHNFKTSDGLEYGVPDPEEDAFWGTPLRNERGVQIIQVLSSEKQRLQYTYDYGVNWEHEILLEKILPVAEDVHYPICIGGKLDAPPEDVGGIPGYESFLEAIADPTNAEHVEFLEWSGGEFNPLEFDMAKVNAALRRIR